MKATSAATFHSIGRGAPESRSATRDVLKQALDLSLHGHAAAALGVSLALRRAATLASTVRDRQRVFAETFRQITVALWKGSSLSSRGTRIHFDISIALTSVIPALALVYVMLMEPSPMIGGLVLGTQVPLAVLGYVMASRYPRAMIQLRDYLNQLAHGEVPDAVRLLGNEADIDAIQRDFNIILMDLKHKIALIREQEEQLIAAERQHAMAASLTAACHHIGQPATVLTACIELLVRGPTVDNGQREMLEACRGATTRLREVLHRLNSAEEFATVDYLNLIEQTEQPHARNNQMLHIHGL